MVPVPPRPLITAKDIYEVPRLAVQGRARLDPAGIGLVAAVAAVRPGQCGDPSHADAQRDHGQSRPSCPHARNAQRIAAENWANRYEERFQYLRAWRPDGWTPEIAILGEEHVTAALAKGRGIIFWAGNFSFNDLIAKIAWRRLGLAVSHFSRPIHGFSTTRFGVRYLNAVRRGIEDRYLGERLMVEPHETASRLAADARQPQDQWRAVVHRRQ